MKGIMLAMAGLAGMSVVAASLWAEPVESAAVALRPLDTQASAAQASPSVVALYKNSRCRKEIGVLDLNEHESNTYHRLPKGCSDEISSLRWNLPPGVVVVFFENGATSTNKGIQYAIFGNGEDLDFDSGNINDELSSWVWYKIG